jgi:hypothetical protein
MAPWKQILGQILGQILDKVLGQILGQATYLYRVRSSLALKNEKM